MKVIHPYLLLFCLIIIKGFSSFGQDTDVDNEEVSLKVAPMSVVWIIGQGPSLKSTKGPDYSDGHEDDDYKKDKDSDKDKNGKIKQGTDNDKDKNNNGRSDKDSDDDDKEIGADDKNPGHNENGHENHNQGENDHGNSGSSASGVDKSRSYLNYMSVAGRGLKNKITIAIANPGIPANTFLYVQVDRGNAAEGKPGYPATNGWVPLSNVPSDLVKGIESCYTGNGPETGHLLKYRWQVDKKDYQRLIATVGEDIIINFTITSDI